MLELYGKCACHGTRFNHESALRYHCPTEVETLLGDPTKAKEKLGWVPETSFEQLVKEMIEADYTSARKDSLVKMAGFQAFDHHE